MIKEKMDKHLKDLMIIENDDINLDLFYFH